jgi:putative ABC transport system substrate-binding protein
VKRRAVLALIASAAASPLAHAQARMKTLGYLSNGADAAWLLKLLAERGHVEGRNLRVEVRTKQGPGVVDDLAAELVAKRPDVLLAFGASNVAALARLTKTIPIVCGGTADPVSLGFAKTVRHPGGNITGLSYGVPEFAQVTIGLMRTVRPELRNIVSIVRKERGGEQEGWQPVTGSIGEAARGAGIGWELQAVDSLAGLEHALGALQPATGMPHFIQTPADLPVTAAVAAANRRRLASAGSARLFVEAGALMHYSLTHADPRGRVAALVDQMLRGANPAQTPFELPDRTNFVVNRATARAIGIELSPELLARATEVIG